MLRSLHTLWCCRWPLLRLGLAVVLLWVVAADAGPRAARLALAALPDDDLPARIAALHADGRFGEAEAIARLGLAVHSDPATRAAIELERSRAAERRGSFTRRARDFGMGALTGGPDGRLALGLADPAADTSLEHLAGAVSADLFVVGDLRDLLVQSLRAVTDGENDPVIVALSSIGLLTTLAPPIDWAPALLKAARRAGALSDPLARRITAAARARDGTALLAVVGDTAAIARASSPASAIRLLRHADAPADLADLARFVTRHGDAGAGALHLIGDAGATLILRSRGAIAAGPDAAQSHRLLFAAARKGPASAGWLTSAAPKALLRPHPLLGLTKSLWKGNADALLRTALERLDPFAVYAVPALALWILIESVLIVRRVRRGRRAGRAVREPAAPSLIPPQIPIPPPRSLLANTSEPPHMPPAPQPGAPAARY